VKRNEQGDGTGDHVMAEHVNDIQDAVVAIQETLGTDPQSTSQTVGDRMRLIEDNARLFRLPAICLYNGDPTLVNGSVSVTEAADRFTYFSYVILAKGLENSTGENYGKTTELIRRAPKVNFCGTIDATESLNSAKIKIQSWINMGAKGVYLENFGYEHGVDRTKQNALLEYIHERKVVAVFSSSDPSNILSSTYSDGMNANYDDPAVIPEDVYIHFGFGVGNPSLIGNQLLSYRSKFGIKIYGLSNLGEELYHYAQALAIIFAYDGFYMQPNTYSSDNILTLHKIIPVAGNFYSLSINVLDNLGVLTRHTPYGEISVNTNDNTFDFTNVQIPGYMLSTTGTGGVGEVTWEIMAPEVIQAINSGSSVGLINTSKIGTFAETDYEKITSAVIRAINVNASQISADAIESKVVEAMAITSKEVNTEIVNAGLARVLDLVAQNGEFGRISTNIINAINANIDEAQIEGARISNLDASKITSGYISVDRLAPGSILADKLTIGLRKGLDYWIFTYIVDNHATSIKPTLYDILGKQYNWQYEVEDSNNINILQLLGGVSQNHVAMLETNLVVQGSIPSNEGTFTIRCSGLCTIYLNGVEIGATIAPGSTYTVVMPSLDSGIHKLQIVYEDTTGAPYIQFNNAWSAKQVNNPGRYIHESLQRMDCYANDTTIIEGRKINAGSIEVDKLMAGNISTNKFNIQSDNGLMIIADNTILIKDLTKVRVQIGKDASNDYNMYVWDASGNLMFNATGITENAIQSAIIRDDMVSDTAGINASKINLSTLFDVINNDSTHTLNSSKIYIDAEGQTLDIAFNSMTTVLSDLSLVDKANLTGTAITCNNADDSVVNINIDGNYAQTVMADSPSPDSPATIIVPNNFDIVSCGKNLFDNARTPSTTHLTSVATTGNSIRVLSTSSADHCSATWNYMLKPNSTYSIKGSWVITSGEATIRAMDSSSTTQLGISTASDVGFTFTTDSSGIVNIVLYSTYATSTIGDVIYSNIQLELGSAVTTYEAYEFDKFTVSQELRKLPDGVCDTIEGNKYIQRVGKIAFDGSADETVVKITTPLTTTSFFSISPVSGIKLSTSNVVVQPIICDKLKPQTANALSTQDIEGIATDISVPQVMVAINKSRLTTDDANGFKLWLTSNPLTVYYELSTPIETTIEPVQLTSYENVTNVSTTANPLISMTASFKSSGWYRRYLVDTTLQAQSTELNIVNGKISALISTTEIEELNNEGVTFYNKFSSVKQTVDDFELALSSKSTTFDDMVADVQENNAKVSATPELIQSVVTSNYINDTISESLQTTLSQTRDSILATVNTSISSLDGSITEAYTNQIKATSDSFAINITELQNSITDNNNNISQINQNFEFTTNGLVIGKTGNPFSVNISNEEMDFKDGEVVVASITGQKMNISKLDVSDSLEIGYHKIEKYNDTITLIRYIG
jgi:hypothetical protein